MKCKHCGKTVRQFLPRRGKPTGDFKSYHAEDGKLECDLRLVSESHPFPHNGMAQRLFANPDAVIVWEEERL